MRVVRTASGILLITLAVLCVVTGGALWTVMRHEGPDGAFSGPVSGLSTPGFAIVVPNVGAVLGTHTSLTAGSGTTVTIDARTAQGPAFVALAPLAAIQAYLGPVPYARVSALTIGTGGVPVTLTPVVVPAVPAARIARGLPGAQRFWIRTGTAGTLTFTPGDHATAGLALLLMRPDAAPAVTATATAQARPGWLGASTWALLSLGTAIAIAATTMLLWPTRRREVIYVVEPSQVPEIAQRLGITLPPKRADDAAFEEAGESAGGVPMQRFQRPDDAPTCTAPAGAADLNGADRDAADRAGAETDGEAVGRAPVGPRMPAASTIAAPMPDAFADPEVRADSLNSLMSVKPATRTNERGTYRSFGTPPPVTPAFRWTKADEAARLDAARVEAARVEASRLDAARVEAARVEASRVDAVPAEAVPAEVARVEDGRIEAAPAEAVGAEAAAEATAS